MTTISHTNPCATQIQIASAIQTEEQPPLMFESKNNIKNAPIPVIPGQYIKKSCTVSYDDDTTSNQRGFNHRSHLKGVNVVGPMVDPAMPPTTNLSLI